MMLPPRTSSPPKRLTPSRCEFESRPLRELPPPFLCAMPYSFASSAGFAFSPSPALSSPLVAFALGALASALAVPVFTPGLFAPASTVAVLVLGASTLALVVLLSVLGASTSAWAVLLSALGASTSALVVSAFVSVLALGASDSALLGLVLLPGPLTERTSSRLCSARAPWVRR